MKVFIKLRSLPEKNVFRISINFPPYFHQSKTALFFQDIFLPHNMSSRIIHSNQSLVLQKVTKQSAGVYRCSVVNSEGETVSDELHFRVQCKYFRAPRAIKRKS